MDQYKNPEVKIGDKVQILHVNHPDSYNKNKIGETGIVRWIVSGKMEKAIAVDFGEDYEELYGSVANYPTFTIEAKPRWEK